MDLSPFVSPDPAVRRDGWSPERKLRFLDHLAARGNVRAACAAVGMTREAAYALRRRDGLFARGWAAALLLAREASVDVLADRAIEGIEEKVYYRGELIDTRRKYDTRLLLAHVARLDRQVEEAAGGAAEDAARFDEILACIGGAEGPEELQVDEEPLPLARDAALDMAADEAIAEVEEAWTERAAAHEHGELPDEEYAQYRAEREAAVARARAEAGLRWDAWFARACETVDTLLGRPGDPEISPGTVSEVSSSSGAATAVGPDGRRYAYA